MENHHLRIGIMGGTFNPVHIGHLLIAEQSYHQYGLDQIVFMPAGHPPHKQELSIADNNDRLAMLKLATENVPYFYVSDYELSKQGLSYTCETLSYLKSKAPDNEYFFIMGADSVLDLEQWSHPERILQLSHILAAVRGDTDISALQAKAGELMQKYGGQISLLGAPELDISSRELRERVAAGDSIRFMVPDSVREYIIRRRLYKEVQKPV